MCGGGSTVGRGVVVAVCIGSVVIFVGGWWRVPMSDEVPIRVAEKYKVEMPKVQSEVQNDPLRIPTISYNLVQRSLGHYSTWTL
jgi:hypothetical protein